MDDPTSAVVQAAPKSAAAADPSSAVAPSRLATTLLVLYLLICMAAVAAYFWTHPLPPRGVDCKVPERLNLFIPILLVGALGGVLHGLASLSIHMGKRDFSLDWWVFYVCRPFLGAGLALTVYFPLASGIAGVKLEPGCEGMYSALAWAGLIGLFSQPGLDKLRDIFIAISNGVPNDRAEIQKPPPDQGPGTNDKPSAAPTTDKPTSTPAELHDPARALLRTAGP